MSHFSRLDRTSDASSGAGMLEKVNVDVSPISAALAIGEMESLKMKPGAETPTAVGMFTEYPHSPHNSLW